MSNNRVVLPLHVYNAMAHCYYGDGPRFHEHIPQPDTIDPQEREGGHFSADISGYTPEEAIVEEWIPKGVAARRKEPDGNRQTSPDT